MTASASSPNPLPLDKILLVGVDTVLGANLALAWTRDATVVGVGGESRGPSGMDLRVSAASCGRRAARRIAAERPAYVVYCGPMAASRWDLEQAVQDAASLAAICTALAAAARGVGAQLTVVSTDAVFAGPRLFHPETRPPAARDEWARAVCRLERLLAREALVVRTCVYGWGPPTAAPTFAEQIWTSLREGIPCPADPDNYATPLLASDLAEPLGRAMRRRITGLFHAAGAERISQHRFAVVLAAMASLPRDAVATPLRSGNASESSLDSRRLGDVVGWTPPMVVDGLARFLRQRDEGWLARLSGRAGAAACLDAA